VQQVLKDCRTALGDEGRVIVRYSGTEKKIRLLVESQREADVTYWTGKLIEAVEAEIGA
jgi:phosphoglucosamine mutase